MTEIWDLWQDDSHSPYMNMAIDEALMLTAAERNRPILRLYEWQEDSISIGYTQKISRVPEDKGLFVRRPTGGGIVYHKHHFTYTVVLPNDHWVVKDTKPVESYNWLNQAVQASLKSLEMSSQLASEDIPKSVDRAGMVCFVTPTKYDLLGLDERKIAGSAQRRAKEGMLHQGSIEMEGIDILSAKKLREVLPQGFAKVLKCEFTKFDCNEELLALSNKICQEKYSTIAWNEKR
ncbi:MAG: lipoate--protein ligase family protein [Lentisphaeraceae bacterium]|nr:lipoate--protein ligase family protein [Lentisphaeraceae bacterium]